MSIRAKKVKGEKYYYLYLNYRIVDKLKSFNKYVGKKKPSKSEQAKLEEKFKTELMGKLLGKQYSNKLISKDEVIKAALFRDQFYKKYKSLSPTMRRKYDVDRMIIFTLTTLTTEDVDVDIQDVVNAYEKESGFNVKEKISKNMLEAIDFIKQNNKVDEKYLLRLHGIAMSQFETKSPGKFRDRQVYIHKANRLNPRGVEIAYRPPEPNKIKKLAKGFVEWYNKTSINPLEKAFITHMKLYKIHLFLDGNKRICRLILNKTLLDNGFPLLNISVKKEEYFENLIKSAESNNLKHFVEFSTGQYFIQIKEFLKKAR